MAISDYTFEGNLIAENSAAKKGNSKLSTPGVHSLPIFRL